MSAVELSLEADGSDGLARGYPDVVSLAGDIIMEQWQPAEAQVEARTLRATSDVDGPAVHRRVRSLVDEQIQFLVPDGSDMEDASRLLNAINGGAARGWLRAQRVGETEVWRSPLRAGSMQLDGSSLRFAREGRYRMSITREPYFESTAAAVSLGTSALRSRMPITLTAPDAGTLASPLILTLQATGSVSSALRIHLFQDRAAPSTWTPNYLCGGRSVSGDDLDFSTVRPAGKNLARRALYRPVLVPTSSANVSRVGDERDNEAFSVAYGRSSSSFRGETELGRLGRLDGCSSIFSGLGRAAIDEDVDYLRLRSYAQPFALNTGWHLYMAPTDGQRSVVAEGTGGLDGGRPQGEPLRLAPEERCVIFPLIETVAAAEYSGTALSLQASIRPRISEII